MTKSFSLFYKITQNAITPPNDDDIKRKDEWIKAAQRTVRADWEPKFIKVTYEIVEQEVLNLQRFFSVCVLYYAIQNEDGREPDYKLLAQYREMILDEALGYNLALAPRGKHAPKVIRKRRSTTEFDVPQWTKFLKTIEETMFQEAGFDFPDSKVFWELAKAHGYEDAKRISVESLKKKYGDKKSN